MTPDFDFWDLDDSPEPKTMFSCKYLKIIELDDIEKPMQICNRDNTKGAIYNDTSIWDIIGIQNHSSKMIRINQDNRTAYHRSKPSMKDRQWTENNQSSQFS